MCICDFTRLMYNLQLRYWMSRGRQGGLGVAVTGAPREQSGHAGPLPPPLAHDPPAANPLPVLFTAVEVWSEHDAGPYRR